MIHGNGFGSQSTTTDKTVFPLVFPVMIDTQKRIVFSSVHNCTQVLLTFHGEQKAEGFTMMSRSIGGKQTCDTPRWGVGRGGGQYHRTLQTVHLVTKPFQPYMEM